MNSQSQAFTLIELLVAVGVLIFITGIGITLFTSLTQQYDKATSITNLQREGDRIMEQIARVVRNGKSLSQDAGSSTSFTILIPEDESNLEYQQNGNCVKVSIGYDSGTNEIIKTTFDARGVGCGVCFSGCALNQTTVAEVEGFTVRVEQNPNRPDKATISFTLKAPASDPSQEARVTLKKTVLTRNY